MIYNCITGSQPIFVHAPGRPEYTPLWPAVKSLSLMMPPRSYNLDNLTIATINNGGIAQNNKILGTFEKSLDLSGLSYEVLGSNVKQWQNKMKISLMYDFIKKVNTPYVLFSDSSDVILIRPINDLIKKFKSLNCKACFNAEKVNWPLDLPKNIIQFEKSLHPYLFLNAGLWIAESSFAKILIEECMIINPRTSHIESEQVYYKFCYSKFYPDIKVDFDSILFQGLNRVDETEIRLFKLLE